MALFPLFHCFTPSCTCLLVCFLFATWVFGLRTSTQSHSPLACSSFSSSSLSFLFLFVLPRSLQSTCKFRILPLLPSSLVFLLFFPSLPPATSLASDCFLCLLFFLLFLLVLLQSTCKFKILPSLTSSLEYGAGASSLVLASVLHLGKILTREEFTSMVLPVVVSLFTSKQRSVRINLLQVSKEPRKEGRMDESVSE